MRGSHGLGCRIRGGSGCGLGENQTLRDPIFPSDGLWTSASQKRSPIATPPEHYLPEPLQWGEPHPHHQTSVPRGAQEDAWPGIKNPISVGPGGPGSRGDIRIGSTDRFTRTVVGRGTVETLFTYCPEGFQPPREIGSLRSSLNGLVCTQLPAIPHPLSKLQIGATGDPRVQLFCPLGSPKWLLAMLGKGSARAS